MFKSAIAVTALGLTTLGLQNRNEPPPLAFYEQSMIIEYFVTDNEAVVKIDAESEERLERIEVRDPRGHQVLKLAAPERPGRGIGGILVDTLESTPSMVFETYPEGIYDLRGRTMTGRAAQGSIALSHDLLPAPVVLYPPDGAVVPTSFVAGWMPDSEAVRYVVEFEQDDNDGLVVELPAGSSSFMLPPGVLAPGKLSHFEVGAVGANGNITVVETEFMTR